MTDRVPVFKPYIGVDTAKAAVDALDLGWLGMGSYVRDFEEGLRQYVGGEGRHVVAVNTGTSALHLAMLLAGVGPGDEVITASFNNIGDFQAILAAGGQPVFCDIRDDDLGIDPQHVEALVGPRTRAIVGMDYAGIPCRIDELLEIARGHGLRLIHDASHSIGTSHRGRKIGSFGDLVTFSFDPVKTMTCIDGGAVVTPHAEEVDALHRMRLLGMDQKAARMYTNNRAWTYDVSAPGFRYHLANLHASVGLTQLAELDRFVESRRRACRLYSKLLDGLPGLGLPASDFADVAPFIYYVRVLGGRRQGLIDALGQRGVDTGIHWMPGHRFSLFSACRRGPLAVTERVGDEILTLPLHSFMDDATVELVAAAVREALVALHQ
jgi:dTDP-4-amino-4,6-dideoxygalactose transaminase